MDGLDIVIYRYQLLCYSLTNKNKEIYNFKLSSYIISQKKNFGTL